MRITTTINRLLALAQFLRELPRRAFDMECWVRDKQERPDEIDVSKHNYTKTPACGTAACLGGWATHIVPELVLRYGDLYNNRTKASGHYAFADAFGLNYDVSENLTNREAKHRTPLKAARVVEEVATLLAAEHGYEIMNA